jgi:tetratricopeptide (TPR) repeat protein/transcriptional regulator with XRE-family HTH domain
MPVEKNAFGLQSFSSFGAMLRYLRRRAHLTQRDLGIAVGYSEGHINRFEKNKRLPDPTSVAALFIPELGLSQEPELAARLIELAMPAFPTTSTIKDQPRKKSESEPVLEPVPPAPAHEIQRPQVSAEICGRLASECRIILGGLAGIGKTTIASAIARQVATSRPVLWITLAAGITNSRDALIRQIAAFLFAHGQERVKPLVQINPNARVSFTLDQQLALISSALERQPALLCIDNAELIQGNEACLQVLRYFGATTPAWILVMTRERLNLPGFTEIILDGFERVEGVSFIANSSKNVLDVHLAGRLVEKTGGNPMLLRLTMGKLADGDMAADDFIKRLEIQPQVAAYLLHTVQEQCSQGAWLVMLLLSIFQRPVNLYDDYLIELAQAQGLVDNMGASVVELQKHHLIDDPTRAHLHPLIQDYVYLTLNVEVATRKQLHRLVADWFCDSNKDLLAAAWHYSLAGLADQAVDVIEENLAALIADGRALPAASILDDVQTQLKRQRTNQTDLLRRLLFLHGILLTGTLRVADGEASLRQAIPLATNPTVRASIICALAELTIQRNDFRETLQLVQAIQAELPPEGLLLRARLHILECITSDALGRPEDACRAAQNALALADQMAGYPLVMVGEIRARAEIELANISRLQRNLPEAMHHAWEALNAARSARHLRMMNLALTFVGGLNYDLGDLDASFKYRNEGLDGLLAIGDVHSAAYILTQLADIHHIRLEETLALDKLNRANEILRVVDDMRGLAATENLRSACLLWSRQVREARRVIDQLLTMAEGKGVERMWGYRVRQLGVVQLVQGETTLAIATLQRALNLPGACHDRMMTFELHTTLAVAFLAAGDPCAAQAALADAPDLEGMSRWTEYDRQLVDGYVALARGDSEAALALANQIAQHARTYPLYRQSAVQLGVAVRQSVSPALFPQFLWVGPGPK